MKLSTVLATALAATTQALATPVHDEPASAVEHAPATTLSTVLSVPLSIPTLQGDNFIIDGKAYVIDNCVVSNVVDNDNRNDNDNNDNSNNDNSNNDNSNNDNSDNDVVPPAIPTTPLSKRDILTASASSLPPKSSLQSSSPPEEPTLSKPHPGQHATPADIERLALPYTQMAYVIGSDPKPFCKVIEELAQLDGFEYDVEELRRDCARVFGPLREGAVREEREMEREEQEQEREEQEREEQQREEKEKEEKEEKKKKE